MKTIVVKLGGSMVSKSDKDLFDFLYVNKFGEVIRKYIEQDYRFFIVLGGGYLMRKYRDMAKEGGVEEPMQLHWIGTTVNVLHAEIVRATLHDISNERIYAYEDYYAEGPVKFEKSVIVGGGGRPGHSGDYDALAIAERVESDVVVSLKNIDGVYTADPKKDPSAKKIDKLSWQEYKEIIGFKTEHVPGGSFPIDPVTSLEAAELKKKFVILGGDDLSNFDNYLAGKDFVGSIVE